MLHNSVSSPSCLDKLLLPPLPLLLTHAVSCRLALLQIFPTLTIFTTLKIPAALSQPGLNVPNFPA